MDGFKPLVGGSSGAGEGLGPVERAYRAKKAAKEAAAEAGSGGGNRGGGNSVVGRDVCDLGAGLGLAAGAYTRPLFSST